MEKGGGPPARMIAMAPRMRLRGGGWCPRTNPYFATSAKLVFLRMTAAGVV
jgi:hypothetical protein